MTPATVCLASELLALGMNGLGEHVLRHEDGKTRKSIGGASIVGIRLSMKTLKNGLTEDGAVAPTGVATERFVIGNVIELLYVPVRIGADNGSCPFTI